MFVVIEDYTLHYNTRGLYMECNDVGGHVTLYPIGTWFLRGSYNLGSVITMSS